MISQFTWSADLSAVFVWIAVVFFAFSVLLLSIEFIRSRRRGSHKWGVLLTGIFANVLLLLAVLRPATILSRGSYVGPKVAVLVDRSLSMQLPSAKEKETRYQVSNDFIQRLRSQYADVRFSWFEFGEGDAKPLSGGDEFKAYVQSDLSTALKSILATAEETPSAVVVISDGRLDRPSESSLKQEIRDMVGNTKVAVNAIAVTDVVPKDASIRHIESAATAVAHQAFGIRVDVGCNAGLVCDEIPVVVKELREKGGSLILAQGKAKMKDGLGSVELNVTLDRAGTRILEFEIESPQGDEIIENNRRFIAFNVSRDRIRILHIAGRPTYDVRALRMWIKSDASVDVVAFFILRTQSSDVNASSEELALIPFPVDELFTEHLPSFDAVVLQDFNAEPYGLMKHLGSLARYVERGGGLIMVGGTDAFVAGHYADTPIATVLPIVLESSGSQHDADTAPFVPVITELGRVSPIFQSITPFMGEEFPEMPGTNMVGDARDSAMVLLSHPTITTKSGAPMPLLTLGEYGNGRTIALTVDGSHRLLFSSFAAHAGGGRAHGAFWDALLGWLMRDPRFEPASVQLANPCVAGHSPQFVIRPASTSKEPIVVKITQLGGEEILETAKIEASSERIVWNAKPLARGGYSIGIDIPKKNGNITTRHDFACEVGGNEWADTRPDLNRLRTMASDTHGKFSVGDVNNLELPKATLIASERQIRPMVAPWIWTLLAAVFLGSHWIFRRQRGFV